MFVRQDTLDNYRAFPVAFAVPVIVLLALAGMIVFSRKGDDRKAFGSSCVYLAVMENLDWLATASVAHQRAIGGIAQHADILPARFGTVFHYENSLRAHIREHVREMEKDFKRIEDAEEWGIKIFETAPVAAPVPQARTGREYLQAKAALLPRRKSVPIPEPELAEFQDALSGLAAESAPAGRISGGQRGLLFQTSLLVKRANRSRLESVLKQFSRKWADSRRIECSGPWPPYSFVSQDSKSL